MQLKYNVIPAGERLDHWQLSAIVPDRPVYLSAFDGHTVWVNSEALRRAGILHGRATAAGSAMVIDNSGHRHGNRRVPRAGRVRPGACRLIPPPTEVERHAALHKGLALCARHGLTSLHNIDNWNDGIAVYAALEDLGEMTVRVYVPYNVEPETPIEQIAEAAELKRRYQGDYVRARRGQGLHGRRARIIHGPDGRRLRRSAGESSRRAAHG